VVGPRRSARAAVLAAVTAPPGPVLLGLPAGPATAPAEAEPPDPRAAAPVPPEPEGLAIAGRAIDRAARPVLVAGLAARAGAVPARLVGLAERLGAVTLTTAKAKGVIPAHHPLHGGTLPGPAARRLLDSADLVVAVGFDPVELPHPWRSPAPIVRVDRVPYRGEYFAPATEVTGDPAAALGALAAGCAGRATWDPREIGAAREAERRQYDHGTGLTPYRLLALAREHFSPDVVVSVDAGAHKQLANVVWSAERPSTYLTSNGLASMAYALPAAAAAAMVTGRRAVCFTGDGGLLMTLGELETVRRLDLPVTVVVFADGGHSIIRVHQAKRGLRSRGVDLTALAYERLAEEVGGRGFAVTTPDEMARALDTAEREGGLSIVAARIDPAWYHALG
jgi:acetolactate synthase-1/2/3 large subunit